MRRLTPLDPCTQPWLHALAAVTLVPHVAHLPAWLSLLAGALVAWRHWAWRHGASMPKPAALYAMVLGGTAGILLEYRTIFGQEPGVALLVLFMALKLMELRSRRDGTAVVMLGYFLLLTHYFYAESLLAGAWMLISLVIITAALIRLQVPAPRSAPALTLRQAGAMILQSLPLMLVLFVLFPRISGPLWGLPHDARRGVTGLSDQMTPGSISELSKSAAIAFRARFDTSLPPRQSLYWRGPVMSDYDGRTWRVGPASLLAGNVSGIESHSPAVIYSLTLEPHAQRWLLALDLPVEFPDQARVNASLSLVRQQPLRERIRYSAASSIDYVANARERPEILRGALALPKSLNPRARALANSWRDSAPAVDTLVAKALALFRDEKFVYTLQPPLLGPNAVDDFLFTTRSGFCEHYASAFVFLMRAAGIPARIVAGYQGGEINPVDGYLVVRQSDAHAWAEVWIEGRGWVRIDPTAAIAPARIEAGIGSALPASDPLPTLVRGDFAWLRSAQHRWEALNNAWNQSVLGYNDQAQQALLSRLGLPPGWQSLISALTFTAGIVWLLVALWIMRRDAEADPAQRLWQRYCARMARLGIPRLPWEGPRAYAARVDALRPELATPTAEAGAAYERLRYGSPWPQDLFLLKAALRKLPHRWKPH